MVDLLMTLRGKLGEVSSQPSVNFAEVFNLPDSTVTPANVRCLLLRRCMESLSHR
jgi:hypothetical protein